MEVIRYEESGMDERILRAVEEMGFENMTPIQAQAIPVMLEGKDVIGQAQTGTGKTAAFGIPVIERVNPEDRNLQALILCPTRELAIQAAEEIRRFSKYMHGIKVLPVYGGQEIYKQIKALKSGVQIIVGTPGRVMDHMRRHTIKTDHIRTVVLDEADEMLNMGFREDMETILKEVPGEHQTALFSATMPKAILDITKEYQKEDAVLVKMAAKELTIDLVKQYYYAVKRQDKEEVSARILDYYAPHRSLIFCNTKRMVDELAENLRAKGYSAEGLHGDLTQSQRDVVMNRFRGGNLDVLIATDVAARGIDVENVEAVINYDIPQDIEYYVHRIGRTGRAGREGRAFTLVSGRELYKIRDIERMCKTRMKEKKVPSAGEITSIKAAKVVKEALMAMEEKDLSIQKSFLEKKLSSGEYTALDLAAALLKLQMGDEIAEISVREERPYREASKGNRFRGNGQNSGRKSFDGRRAGRDGGRSVKSGDRKRDGSRHAKAYDKNRDDGRTVRAHKGA